MKNNLRMRPYVPSKEELFIILILLYIEIYEKKKRKNNVCQTKRLTLLADFDIKHIMVPVYVVSLRPRRLNSGNTRVLPDGGDLNVAHALQQPDHPYTAAQSNRNDDLIGAEAEAEARGGNEHRNRDYNIHDDATRRADNLNGRGRRFLSIKVRYQGSEITLQVQKSTPVNDFIRSREFVTKVSEKWSIPEHDLQNMVLRNQDRVIETLEFDCILHLRAGHTDLFLESFPSP
ncbi:uncharacterized protein LOC132559448 [Ylistrum balloti]|uniref:uncharacterized protein LOC132559448 n=1 Tax=Ylistrum balloti TaxID=509963 RepID=UPI00290591F4|nr:uncharacterized protein LOC132559448 [Ylistrum balloti]